MWLGISCINLPGSDGRKGDRGYMVQDVLLHLSDSVLTVLLLVKELLLQSDDYKKYAF